MYSSNTSLNGNDLISYPNQPFCFRPFSFESNPTSKLQQQSNSNSNYALPPPPSSLSFFQFDNHQNNNIFLEQQHHDLLLHHHHQSLPEIMDLPPPPPSPPPQQPIPPFTMMDQQVPRKRSSKRDRHSKINTARGLRDRRMRLSLDVAKRFFGLQDMLGFDKASKTVEWLLNQSKVEIKQLARGKSSAKSASSTSECEGVSSLDEVVVSGINQDQEGEQPHVKRRATKVCRKSAFNPIGKESREKARERARERTRQKMRTRKLANDSNLNRLSSWNPFESVEESVGGAQSQSVNHPSLDLPLPEAEEPCSHAKDHLGTVEEDNSLVIINKWSPTMMFNSLSNSTILQEHQLAEFLGKPWEAYDNHM